MSSKIINADQAVEVIKKTLKDYLRYPEDFCGWGLSHYDKECIAKNLVALTTCIEDSIRKLQGWKQYKCEVYSREEPQTIVFKDYIYASAQSKVRKTFREKHPTFIIRIPCSKTYSSDGYRTETYDFNKSFFTYYYPIKFTEIKEDK